MQQPNQPYGSQSTPIQQNQYSTQNNQVNSIPMQQNQFNSQTQQNQYQSQPV